MYIAYNKFEPLTLVLLKYMCICTLIIKIVRLGNLHFVNIAKFVFVKVVKALAYWLILFIYLHFNAN